jgi:Na+-transporting NADH:ubiquinone oxidoreductase subunit F
MNILIVLGPLAIAGLSALLAAVISLTDKVVNNYGEVKITINSGKKVLTVNGGDTLLSTLASNKIFIPSACGGKGTCGTCKVKVTTDIGDYLPTEIPLLEKEEINSNIRLSCQIKVKKDIEIEIPDELFAIQEYKTKVESIKDLTHDIKEITVKLDNQINFKSGQYAQLIIPPYNNIKNSTQRAYSISSSPQDKNHLEFLIRLVPGGIATTYVHTVLKENDTLNIIAPVGDFYLNDSDSDILCIAGGSGMAPIKSILFDMQNRKITDRKVWYFFGAVSLKDLFYTDLMKNLENEMDNVKFIPALSEPAPEDNWTGEKGLITEVLDNYLKSKIKTDKGWECYLCGSPGMIDACINILNKHNITSDKIFFDKFG